MNDNFAYKAYDQETRQLTVGEWVKILRDKEVTKNSDLQILRVVFYEEDYALNGKEIARSINHPGKHVNGQIMGYARRIANKYDIEFRRKNEKTQYWAFFFHGKYNAPYFWWQLKPNLIEALKQLNKERNDFNDTLESEVIQGNAEGERKLYYTTKYERNKTNRDEAI